MKKMLPLLLLCVAAFSSCKKCYDCTKKCGSCTQNGVILAGCTGDDNLNGASVDTWKVYLEAQGYTCTYNNIEEEACGKDDKTNKEEGYFECVAQ